MGLQLGLINLLLNHMFELCKYVGLYMLIVYAFNNLCLLQILGFRAVDVLMVQILLWTE